LKIIDAALSQRDKNIISVLAVTGLRNFELCDLRISDFDFKNLRIINKVRKGKGGKSGDFIITKEVL
jgi:integrase